MTEQDTGQDILPVTPRNGVEELESLLMDPIFEAGYVAAQTLIDPELEFAKMAHLKDEAVVALSLRLQDSKRAELSSLREELVLRRGDPELAEALDVWGRSPNYDGSWGVNGQGFNAGVVHYFGYRAAEDTIKVARFREAGPPTIKGFIDISTYLGSLVHKSEEMLVLKMLSEVGDSGGQKRRFLLTWDNWIVVAFERPDDKMGVITLIPGQDTRKFQIMVDNERDGIEPPDRLNKLGAQRTQTI